MLNRDDALKICETVLDHAKAAGAEDAAVSVANAVESHARFADNRITTSGRSEDLDITATVWIGKRRGAATVNDSSAAALKQIATDAVQTARISPVQREYIPTLGALEYGPDRGFAAATAEPDLNARATALQGMLDACKTAKVTGAGFHAARASANASATANGNRRYFRNSRADLSVTARTPDGTGSGYYAGDHFDLAKLDAQHIAQQAVNKAVKSRNPQPIEPGNYPVILEPQAVSDLLGFLTGAFDARTAEEGRSAFSAKDGKTHLGEATPRSKRASRRSRARRAGLAFSSGMAAEDAVLRALVGPGDHIVIPHDAYGGTYRLVSKVLAPTGVAWSSADLGAADALRAAWTEATKVVWVETPTNPTLGIVDIAAVAEVAHERGGIVVVDNTFATPYLQRPLELGADIVVHSMTKYLGGHSDVVGGFVAVADAELGERIAFLQGAVGAVPGPFDCYLVLRGIKTLGVRMDRHCANAQAVAEMLDAHPKVDRVLYPGLASHPGHEVAARQMSGFGGMVSFLVAGGEAAALELAARTSVFTLAESLGAVESLIEHPARMTHASTEGSELAVDPALIRLSVGIETLADLLTDLDQAL